MEDSRYELSDYEKSVIGKSPDQQNSGDDRYNLSEGEKGVLSGKFLSQKAAPVAAQVPSLLDRGRAIAEAVFPLGAEAARVVGGGLSSIPANVAGLITGDKQLRSDIQQRGTYEPVTPQARKISQIFEGPSDPGITDILARPYTWPGIVAEKTGQAIGGERGASALGLGTMLLGGEGAGIPISKTVRRGIDIATTAQEPKAPILPPEDAMVADKLKSATPELKQAVIDKMKANEPINRDILHRHLEADSLPVPVRLTDGQAAQDVNVLSAEQNARGKHPQLAQRFNEQNGQLVENINAIRDKAAPDVTGADHVDNGRSLIDAYKAKDTARQAEVNANYDELAKSNGGTIPIDGKAFAKDVQQKLGSGSLVSQEEFLPSTVKNIVDRVSKSDQPMTMNDFVNLRKILAKEVNKASRSGDGNAVGAIKSVRDSLENIPMGPEAEKLKPLADKAKNSARQLFQDRENDPAWSAVHEDSIAPDDFVKKFVVGGKVDDVARMRQNLGDNPLADQTIKAGAINYLKDRAGLVRESGNFSQAGYNKGLQQIAPKLRYLVDDETANHLNTLGNVAKYTQMQPRGSYVNVSGTLVGALAEKAGGGLEAALNMKTGGAASLVKSAIKRRAEEKAVQKSLEPAAGITRIKDIPR